MVCSFQNTFAVVLWYDAFGLAGTGIERAGIHKLAAVDNRAIMWLWLWHSDFPGAGHIKK